MNSAQLCQTEEWIEFRNKLWQKLYRMELSYHWIEDVKEWIRLGCPDLPHPKEGGEVIKCAYCGWYGENTSKRYHVLDHVRPVHAFPELSFDEGNLVVACNHCNKEKGGTVKHGTIKQIIAQFKKDLVSGKACAIPTKKKIRYKKTLVKSNGKYRIVLEPKRKFLRPTWMS